MTVTWAGKKVKVKVRPAEQAAPVATPLTPGELTLGREPAEFPLARLSPSAALPIECTLGEPVEIGPRLSLRGTPDMEHVGHAVHAFLAADRPGLSEPDRLALAAELLERHRVAAHLDPDEVAAAATRLWRWLDTTFDAPRLHREWPLAHRLDSGTVVAGTADLLAHTPAGYAVIDHKTFPGTLAQAISRLPAYSGQLATYAAALTAATGTPVQSTWIHLPILGTLVELRC